MTKSQLDKTILFHLILQDKECLSDELGDSDMIIKFRGHEYNVDSKFIKDINWMAKVLKQRFKTESY